MMRFTLATQENAREIYELVQKTVKTIYPRYYLPEIVDMFCEYHSIEKIEEDIANGRTYKLIIDNLLIGSGTIKDNHINRVYVLPEYQNKGYGSYLMSKLEMIIAKIYATASIDASLPACRLYEKLGYKTTEHGIWECANGVIQIYEIMEKKLMTESIKLRPYKAIDANVIAGWIKDERALRMWSSDRFGEYPITAKDINYKYLECNGDCIEPDNFYPLVATENGKPTGHLIMRYTDEDTIRFGFVIVDDSIRNQGYGKRMLKLAIEYAFSILGAKRITLGVFDNNPGAYYCYKAVGFEEIETGKDISFEMFGETWKIIEMDMRC